jgi:hypothetical protein
MLPLLRTLVQFHRWHRSQLGKKKAESEGHSLIIDLSNQSIEEVLDLPAHCPMFFSDRDRPKAWPINVEYINFHTSRKRNHETVPMDASPMSSNKVYFMLYERGETYSNRLRVHSYTTPPYTQQVEHEWNCQHVRDSFNFSARPLPELSTNWRFS